MANGGITTPQNVIMAAGPGSSMPPTIPVTTNIGSFLGKNFNVIKNVPNLNSSYEMDISYVRTPLVIGACQTWRYSQSTDTDLKDTTRERVITFAINTQNGYVEGSNMRLELPIIKNDNNTSYTVGAPAKFFQLYALHNKNNDVYSAGSAALRNPIENYMWGAHPALPWLRWLRYMRIEWGAGQIPVTPDNWTLPHIMAYNSVINYTERDIKQVCNLGPNYSCNRVPLTPQTWAVNSAKTDPDESYNYSSLYIPWSERPGQWQGWEINNYYRDHLQEREHNYGQSLSFDFNLYANYTDRLYIPLNLLHPIFNMPYPFPPFTQFSIDFYYTSKPFDTHLMYLINDPFSPDSKNSQTLQYRIASVFWRICYEVKVPPEQDVTAFNTNFAINPFVYNYETIELIKLSNKVPTFDTLYSAQIFNNSEYPKWIGIFCLRNTTPYDYSLYKVPNLNRTEWGVSPVPFCINRLQVIVNGALAIDQSQTITQYGATSTDVMPAMLNDIVGQYQDNQWQSNYRLNKKTHHDNAGWKQMNYGRALFIDLGNGCPQSEMISAIYWTTCIIQLNMYVYNVNQYDENLNNSKVTEPKTILSFPANEYQFVIFYPTRNQLAVTYAGTGTLVRGPAFLKTGLTSVIPQIAQNIAPGIATSINNGNSYGANGQQSMTNGAAATSNVHYN